MEPNELNKLKAALPPNMSVQSSRDRVYIYNEHDEEEVEITYEKTAGDAITKLLSHYCASARSQMKHEMQRDFKKLMGLDEDLRDLREKIIEGVHAAMR